jgi:AcrR family transcriptional regulator
VKHRNSPEAGNARERILKAARQVFALNSYQAATTRMVAKAAHVEHPLIHYYFGSKEKLYEAVTADIYEAYGRAQETWLEGFEHLRPQEGLSIFLDRMIDYHLSDPGALQLVALNMVHIGRLEEIPGHRYIILQMARMRRMLEKRVPLKGSSREIEMFIYCFHNLIISLLGAMSCQAQLLNMDPEGNEYRAWVKDASLTLFLPWLERLIARR